MIEEELIQKTSNLRQALALGATLLLSPMVSLSSATTETPLGHYEPYSSSACPVEAQQDFSEELARASREVEFARSLLSALDGPPDLATASYLERLGDILDAAMKIDSDGLPAYSNLLANSLQSSRSELIAGVASASAWTRLSRALQPSERLVLPARFVSRRPARQLSLPVSQLRAAEFLRSNSGPHTT